jgi:predicted metal-binding membrane protein
MSTMRYPRATLVVGAALLVLTGLAWVVTIGQANSMSAMVGMGSAGGMRSSGMSGGSGAAGTLIDLTDTLTLAIFLPMWVVMMAAMMLPSAAPMILLFDRVSRNKVANSSAFRAAMPTAVFVGGYLLTWTAFGLLAYAVGLALSLLGVHWPALAAYRPALTGALLTGAGIYQISPLKGACLKHCRSPLAFLTHHWRTGRGAAARMGAEHGLYCVGCCWGLMLVLFAVGLMNLVWMGLVSLLVLAEKVLPGGRRISWGVAVLLVVAGTLAAAGHLPGVAA